MDAACRNTKRSCGRSSTRPTTTTTAPRVRDFLQENGEEDRAEFIRVSCEGADQVASFPGDPGYARLSTSVRAAGYVERTLSGKRTYSEHRGFGLSGCATLWAEQPNDLTSSASGRVQSPRVVWRKALEGEPGG